MSSYDFRTTLAGALTLALLLTASATGQEEDKRKKKKDRAEENAAQKVSESHHRTFSQADWSGAPDGNEQAKQLLRDHFDKAFPSGLRVGQDRKGRNQVVLKNAKAVLEILPIRGVSAPLADSGDESLEATGGLGGNLVAAKLNVAFDEIGELGHRKEKGETPLADLLLSGNVKRSLEGLSVQEIIRLSDWAIGGKYGQDVEPFAKVVDVDRDGDGDASLMDLREALSRINRSLRRGSDFAGVLTDSGTRNADDDEELEEQNDREAERRQAERRRRAEEGNEDAEEEAEREFDEAEEERDRELLEAEREREREHEEADREGDKRKRAEQRRKANEKYSLKRAELDRKFEEKWAKIEAKWTEKGLEHPGRGKGLEGVHPGRGKGLDKDKGKGKKAKGG